MKICDWVDTIELAVQQVGKPAVHVSNRLSYDTPEDDEIWDFVVAQMRAIYGDKTPQFYDVMSSLVPGGLFFFENEEEQYRFYKVFEQPLPYSSAIYACTVSRDGKIETENT
jgi:hypothetical protein